MDLSVTQRTVVGKGLRALRREGLVPAELYGHGAKNEHLSVPAKEFGKILKEAGSSTVVYLVLGKEKHPALIHDVQKNFLTGEVEHIDFYQVRMDEKIKAMVPLEFSGESKAAKEEQAMIMKAMTEIEVEALPGDLPHSIAVDISALDALNKSVYVKDLALPKGVKVLVEDDTVVVTATPPVKEEEVAAAPAEAPDLSAIKSEAEEKVAERAAEKTDEK